MFLIFFILILLYLILFVGKQLNLFVVKKFYLVHVKVKLFETLSKMKK